MIKRIPKEDLKKLKGSLDNSKAIRASTNPKFKTEIERFMKKNKITVNDLILEGVYCYMHPEALSETNANDIEDSNKVEVSLDPELLMDSEICDKDLSLNDLLNELMYTYINYKRRGINILSDNLTREVDYSKAIEDLIEIGVDVRLAQFRESVDSSLRNGGIATGELVKYTKEELDKKIESVNAKLEEHIANEGIHKKGFFK